jgi:hypothetical protein
MDILLDVIGVIPQEDRTLLLTFENQEKRRFDMKPYLGKTPFRILENLSLFMKAMIACRTAVWPGNLDIAPETLYDDSEPV